MVVDVHAHIIPRSAVRAHELGVDWFGTTITKTSTGAPAFRTGSYTMALGATEYWLPLDERIPYLDDAGVDIQIVSLSPQLFRDYLDRAVAVDAARAVNDEIAETVANEAGRFAGLAVLPLQDTDAALQELDRAISRLGLMGVIIGSHVAGTNWDDPRLFPILEEASSLGAFVLQHPFNNRIRDPFPRYHLTNLIGNPLETTIFASCLILGGVLDRLPDLKICLSHTGGYLPFAVRRFDHAYQMRDDARGGAIALPSEYLRRFFYDCISHSGAVLRYAVEAVGADRILLGTDFPADMGLRRPIEWLETMPFLTEMQRAEIMSANAVSLGLDRDSRSEKSEDRK